MKHITLADDSGGDVYVRCMYVEKSEINEERRGRVRIETSSREKECASLPSLQSVPTVVSLWNL